MPKSQKASLPKAVSAGPSTAIKVLLISTMLLLIGIGGFWWSVNSASSEKVFYDMLDRSMQTRGVTKEVVQEGQQTLKQTIQLRTGMDHATRAEAVLSQPGDASTSVTTESIGTPQEDYVKYLSIVTDQRDRNNQALNFDALIGKWGRSNNNDSGTPQTDGELYGQMVLGVVPFSYVEQAKRNEILSAIRELDVYEVDFDQVERDSISDRPVYKYKVKMQLDRYVAILKQFARAVGLKQLEELDPEEYKGSDALLFEFAVDIRSRQLVEIDFIGNSRTETFSSYGAEVDIVIPEETISIDELQNRLQQIAQ